MCDNPKNERFMEVRAIAELALMIETLANCAALIGPQLAL